MFEPFISCYCVWVVGSQSVNQQCVCLSVSFKQGCHSVSGELVFFSSLVWPVDYALRNYQRALCVITNVHYVSTKRVEGTTHLSTVVSI